MNFAKILLSIFLLVNISSCGLATARPKVEMSLAQAAFLAAKEAKAEIYAANLYRKAEIYYLKAKSAYRRKYFNKAKSYAELCKKFSEQAEYEAIKKTIINE
jgi:hypothetical protein